VTVTGSLWFGMSTVKRKSRREKAAETRVRMIEAALEVFGENGYTGTRMADIATRAHVAVQTLYFTFHTKPELLQACYEHAVLGPEKVAPMATPEIRAAFSARSGRTALRSFVEGNARIVARAAAIDEVARAASHEPEALEVRRHSEQLRRDGYRSVVTHLQERFGLRDGLDEEAAVDLMLMLAGGATYLSLRSYGWSDARYAEWLADLLATQLLRRPGRAT